jgi:hypothetical protein
MGSLPEIRSKAFQAARAAQRAGSRGWSAGDAGDPVADRRRTRSAQHTVEIHYLPVLVLLVGAMMVHEGVMLSVVNRRIAAGKDLPAWRGTVNLLAETLFPYSCAAVVHRVASRWDLTEPWWRQPT